MSRIIDYYFTTISPWAYLAGDRLERIAAEQEFPVMLERAHDGLLAARETALTPAEHAVVGFDLDEKLVARADPDGVGADFRNLHDGPVRGCVSAVSRS